MTIATRDFHVGVLLSILGDKMICLNGIEDFYDILNFMTAENLYTHQLPRAAHEVRPEILRQHPDLGDYDDISVTRSNSSRFLNAMVAKYGEFRSMAPFPPREPKYDTPVADAIEITGDCTKVIVLTATRGPDSGN